MGVSWLAGAGNLRKLGLNRKKICPATKVGQVGGEQGFGLRQLIGLVANGDLSFAT